MEQRNLCNYDVAQLCEEYFGSGSGVSDNVVQALVRGESNTYSGVDLLTLIKLELVLSETLVEIYFPLDLPEPVSKTTIDLRKPHSTMPTSEGLATFQPEQYRKQVADADNNDEL